MVFLDALQEPPKVALMFSCSFVLFPLKWCILYVYGTVLTPVFGLWDDRQQALPTQHKHPIRYVQLTSSILPSDATTRPPTKGENAETLLPFLVVTPIVLAVRQTTCSQKASSRVG